MTEYDRQYKGILQNVYTNGVEELNQRTGSIIRALPSQTISIGPEHGHPALTLRQMSLQVMVAEPLWFLSGSRRPDEFFNKFAKIWDDFSNYDGTVSTAYGFRWRRYFGRDQIGDLVSMLENDNSSRHGVVFAWDPGSDGLGGISRKNIPCPIGFTTQIIGDKLHLQNMVRSNDLVPGCPFDVTSFALIQRLLAARLDVGVGTYSHWISHAHIYKSHYGVVEEILSRDHEHGPINFSLKREHFDRAVRGLDDLDDLVNLTKEIVEIIKPHYHPLPRIKNIPIVM